MDESHISKRKIWAVGAVLIGIATPPPALAQQGGVAPIIYLPSTVESQKQVSHPKGPDLRTARSSSSPSAAKGQATALRTANSALQVLINQAGYWSNHGRNDLVRTILRRALAAQPDDPEVLYKLGVLAALDGDNAEANGDLAKLTALAPGTPHIARLKQAIARGVIPLATIKQARAMAKAGKIADALVLYRKAFKGLPPPEQYAFEYYMTLAGIPKDWFTARQALQILLQRSPNNVNLQIAYAQILTYREIGRRDAIKTLSKYAKTNPTAHEFWRKALLWMDADKSDQHYYTAYLARYPDDKEVAARLAKINAPPVIDSPARAVSAAYDALSDGKPAKAEAYFQLGLKLDPENPVALGGLGIYRLKQHRFKEAADLLRKAVSLLPTPDPNYTSALAVADFFIAFNAAQRSFKAGHYARTERLIVPLLNAKDGSAENRQLAHMLFANVLLQEGKYAAAETRYRQILKANPHKEEALNGLYQALIRLNKLAEAKLIEARIPKAIRDRLAGSARAAEADGLRAKAESRMVAGDYKSAKALYEQALTADPSNPWIRLGLARLLVHTGGDKDARELMRPFSAPGVTGKNQLYAAAIFASEAKDYDRAQALIDRIPKAKRTSAMIAYGRQIKLEKKIKNARLLGEKGDQGQAINALRALSARADLTKAMRGDIAYRLYDIGDRQFALGLVNAELAKGVKGAASDYAALAGVLVRAGRDAEAEGLIARLRTQAGRNQNDLAAIADLSANLAASQTDQLREAGKFAQAYDVNAVALRASPDNAQLLAALARLYRAGKMYPQAMQIYDRLLANMPDNPGLVAEATWVAIDQHDYQHAHALLDPVLANDPDSAKLYYVAGQLARAEGNLAGAIRNLKNARRLRLKELGVAGASASASASASNGPRDQPSVSKDANPFRKSALAPSKHVTIARRTVLTAASGATVATSDMVKTAETAMSKDGAAADVRSTGQPRNRQPRLAAYGTVFLPSARKATAASGPTLIHDRGDARGTARTMNSDTIPVYRPSQTTLPTIPAYGRPSTATAAHSPEKINPFRQATDQDDKEQELVLNSAAVAVDPLSRQINAALVSVKSKVAPELYTSDMIRYRNGTYGLNSLVELSSKNSVSFSPANTGRLTVSVNPVVMDSGQPSTAHSSHFGANPLVPRALVVRPKEQSAAGVSIDAAYAIEDLKADIGLTPLGFQIENIQGGVRYSPAVSDNLRLKFNLDRRPVTDSVLSYAGSTDPVTGALWGGVMRSGGTIGAYFDHHNWGGYATTGYYVYDGKRVKGNSSIEENVGAYIRPYRTKTDALQVGLDFYYSHYNKNQNFFSLGHGGYFSSQKFYAISMPIGYKAIRGKWKFDSHLALGYQHVRSDSALVFPNDRSLEAQLAPADATYHGSRSSGIGASVKGHVDYKVTPAATIGMAGSYSNFGDYNEATGMAFFRYNFGE